MNRIDWNTPVSALPGVGAKREAVLRGKGLSTVGALLRFFPLRYEDHTKLYTLEDAPENQNAALALTVCSPASVVRFSGRAYVRVQAADDTGVCTLYLFQLRFVPEWLTQGANLWVFGRVERQGRFYRMGSPTLFREPQQGLVPVYPRIPELPGATLRKLVDAALQAELPDPLPEDIREVCQLPALADAYAMVHRPASMEEAQAGQRRFAFEELLLYALRQKAASVQIPEGALPIAPEGAAELERALPFALTGAQKRCIREALADMAAPTGQPMQRLLQGDVGSGKTAVAAACVSAAARSGMQAVVMAPTEILARQEQATLARMLAPLGIGTDLLVSGLPVKERRAVLARLCTGETKVLVGTHAVLVDDVQFRHLALVVTDEQHRFGVSQRAKLAQKGEAPHLLFMSATPIPRTLAMALYGDLAVSRLDEMPPGRTPIQTRWVSEKKRQAAYGFVQSQLTQGRQAYVVCPHIDAGEEDDGEMHTVLAQAETLKKWLPEARVEAMYGNMPDKERVMAAFSAGEIQVLVSTTVVEVGVDVPNATVMVIENAERFGLSQLHQLRGRVGRGKYPGFCILFAKGEGDNLKARMEAFCGTTDGFAIAEADLALRGPGDFLGTRQSGIPGFQAVLDADPALLEAAQKAADTLWDPAAGRAKSPYWQSALETAQSETGL